MLILNEEGDCGRRLAMGIISNLAGSSEGRLPVYEPNSPGKERYSNDDYYYTSSSDDDAASSTIGRRSGHSSRSVSDSMSNGSISLLKKKVQQTRNTARRYPYRLPTRITRYLMFGVIGIIVLMVLSLVRASQVENWKIANNKRPERPAPPPAWENFPFLERYYGGIRTLKSLNESEPSYPIFDESTHQGTEAAKPTTKSEGQPAKREIPSSESWSNYKSRAQESDAKECFIDEANKVRVPEIHYYNGRPHGFPENIGGSYEILKLPEDICYERFGRYGPYGFGYSTRKGGLGTGEHGESEGSASVWSQTPHVDFRKVDWADAQRRCFSSNAGRYKSAPARPASHFGFYISDEKVNDLSKREDTEQKPETQVEKTGRTAVVVRCWDEFFFREDDVANLRALISELSLSSGGRYDIHLLVQVKNDAKYPIWADNEAYLKRIKETIPQEFRGLVTMWTETQMLALYQGIHDVWSRGPDLPVHGSYRGLSMAMQHFAYMHPEYDYYWQWEMDIRYTGHYFDLVNKVENWAKAQPRKGLWERNSRFYIPASHGSWQDFTQMSRVQSEMGTVNADNLWEGVAGKHEKKPESVSKKGKTVWGPVRPEDENDWFEHENDPKPPTAYERDRYEWGVGEDADFITLNPIFDPEGTTWGLKDDITGFNRSHPLPTRRASIITTSRMSRRLLMSMHRATAFKKQFAFPEMWPATVALQHGYKAVYVPHPIYVDRKWPVEYLTHTLNAGLNGATGGARASVYGDREHNLKGLTWFYNAGFAPNLYRRWLGLKVNNDGGDVFEKEVDKTKKGDAVNGMAGGEGRMCLPPMLLHPIKDVELPVETPEEEDEENTTESDPAA